MEEWFRKPIYRGCAFINSVAELGGALPDVLAICHSHKQDMVMAVRELLADMPGRDGLAQAAAVAIDGAIVRAQTEAPDAEVKESLRSLALVLSALQAASAAAPETAQQ